MCRLKSCPFCGSNNVRLRVVTDIDGNDAIDWDVFCYNCFAEFRYPEAESVNDIADAWNKRDNKEKVKCKECSWITKGFCHGDNPNHTCSWGEQDE